MDKTIEEMLAEAKAFVEAKKREGWTQQDFADALGQFYLFINNESEQSEREDLA